MGLGGHTNRDREPIAAFCPLSRPRALHRRTTRNWTTARCTGAYCYVRPEQHDRRLLYASHGRAGWNIRQHYGLLRRPARPSTSIRRNSALLTSGAGRDHPRGAGRQYVGVDLYQFFLDLESARAVQLFPSLPVFSPYRHKNRACMCMPYWPKHYAIILMALDHKQR